MEMENFKNVICQINRLVPNATVKFEGNVWVGKKEESDFEEHTFSTIKEITIKFNAKEKDNEVIVKVS
tara:strand:- start:41 stop:244 length:204 start_codon:yes stop_codon:yes gene_type:complete